MNGDVVFSRPGVDVRPELEHVAPGPRVAAGAVAVVHKDLERGEVGPVAAIAVRVVGAHVAAAVELVFIGRAGAGYEVGAKEGSRCDVEIDRLEGGKVCECVPGPSDKRLTGKEGTLSISQAESVAANSWAVGCTVRPIRLEAEVPSVYFLRLLLAGRLVLASSLLLNSFTKNLCF